MIILSNYISLGVLLFNYYAIFEALFGNLEFILGIQYILYIEHLIKDYTQNYIHINILKRPDGAYDCGLFNDGGLIDHKSGFPSGHMSVTSFFSHLYYFKYSNNINWKYYVYYNFINVLMAYARYSKKCHNIFQILGGYLLGYLIAYKFNYISKFFNNKIIKNENENQINDD